MFILGKVKAKDEYDRLVSEDHHGKSNVEARKYVRAKALAERERAVTDAHHVTAGMFDASSAGITKATKFNSTRGPPLALSNIKLLNASDLARQQPPPLDVEDRVLTDDELVDSAIRRSLLTGHLDLKGRNMATLPQRVMSTVVIQFGNLRSINFNNNALETLPAGLAPMCPRLTSLSVANNRLRHVPRSILYLPAVTELNLSENFIGEVDVIQAPQMVTLRMSHNHVSKLDSLSYMRRLKWMHLNHCHLVNLSSHIKKLKNLTFLDLSYNTLVSLALPSRDAAVSAALMAKADAEEAGDGGDDEPKGVVASAAVFGDKRVWERVVDPVSGQTSYFCKSTREVRRTKPPGFDNQQASRKTKLERQVALLKRTATEKSFTEHVPDYVLAKAAAAGAGSSAASVTSAASSVVATPPVAPIKAARVPSAKSLTGPGSVTGGVTLPPATPVVVPAPDPVLEVEPALVPGASSDAAAEEGFEEYEGYTYNWETGEWEEDPYPGYTYDWDVGEWVPKPEAAAGAGEALPDATSTVDAEKEEPEADKPRLKGWQLTVDNSSADGAVYYTNLGTGITQWDMPKEMDGLDFLENVTELNISHNRLTDIPPGVFRMKSLTDLNAEHNLIFKLPTNMYMAKKLTRINLSWNKLVKLPDQICSMVWLEYLTLDNNLLESLPESINKMQGLKVFWIGMNSIKELPFSFGKMPDTMDVMLLDNPFKFPTLADIQKGLKHVLWTCRHEGLKYFRGPPPTLKVVHTGIQDEANFYESDFVKQLAIKVSDAQESLKLDMNFQNLRLMPRHLLTALWECTCLTDLRLVGNKFNKLPPQFQNYTRLTNLVLRGNQLTELPDVFDRVCLFESLNVENNLLTALPATFKHLTRLRTLTLSNNRLMMLPSAVTKFTKLTNLVVESNYLKQLPDKLGNLRRLKYFSCARNRIKRLPRSISQLRKLRSLVAYQNRLGDRGVPDTLCDMDGLRVLRLSHNSISRLPYRFSSSPLMNSLRTLWLYGNQFFDVGDLPLRLGSISDFRIDINPLVNPPPRYSTGQIKSLVEYTSLRIFRLRDIQARCKAEGWTVDPTRLVPVACRTGHFITDGYGTLTDDELARMDVFVEKYVNGDIVNFTVSPKPLIDDLLNIHRRRRFKYTRGVYMEFQRLLQFVYDYDFVSDEYFCTSLTKPWGRRGEDVEVYAFDMDAFYVSTGFRIAILDFFRGPARLGLANVCRFAPAEEFQPKAGKKKNWFTSRREKAKKEAEAIAAVTEEAGEGGGRLSSSATDAIWKAATGDGGPRPKGNWLWQLVTEVVPAKNDQTDVLNDQLPPPCNRYRNPECHPTGGPPGPSSMPPPSRQPTVSDSLVPVEEGLVEDDAESKAGTPTAAGGGFHRRGAVGGIDLVSSPEAQMVGKGRHLRIAEINEKRLAMGMEAVVDPDSPAEVEKRIGARRGALAINCFIKFAVPREELESILLEYEGPYGPVAGMDDEIPFPDCPHPKFEAYANGEPIPDPDLNAKTVPLQLEKARGKKHKGKRVVRKEEYDAEVEREDEGYETSDSEAERAQQEALLDGKHLPCWREGWVVEKWTLTPHEAERREVEEGEVYELSRRLRELIDEFAATAQGIDAINDEVLRRQDAAKLAVRDQAAKVEETRKEMVDVRTQQLDVLEREKRFKNGWDFPEHRFRSQHEIDKAKRRAQDEVNEWEAFLYTEEERLTRREGRAAYTLDEFRDKLIQGMERVQSRKARAMVYHKNRQVAYRRGWRRLWDGRGGHDFDDWKKEQDAVKRMAHTVARLREESDYESSDEEQAGMRREKTKPPRVKVDAYDVAGTYSDPRTRRFSFGSETGSEDERDKAEARIFMEDTTDLELSDSDSDVPNAGAGAGDSDY